MPGLLLCFVLRYDNYKKQANGEVPGPGNMSGRMQRVSYFHCTLIGYFVGKQAIDGRMDGKGQGFYCCLEVIVLVAWIFFQGFLRILLKMHYVIDDATVSSGLLTATVASRIHRAAQPALLYLVPFTLLPLLTMAYLKVH